MLRRIWLFAVEYKKLSFVLIAAIAGLLTTLYGNVFIANWILAIAALAMLVPMIIGMVESVKNGQYGLDVLAATAILTSVLLGEYWTGLIIALMLAGGEALEVYAERRAKTELTALLAHKPKMARLVVDGDIREVEAGTVAIGDIVAVLPGDVVPVDAVIIEGSSSLDESSLTGESLPVEKVVGDEVLGGSINLEGLVHIRTIRVAADSQYEQIIALVRSASTSQSPFVRLTDRYSIPFTIVSFAIAGTVWLLSGDPVRFLQVIVVATPCPLLLAAPIALISGMSRAAKHGIIVKTGSAMERLAAIKTVAFDKTGTLTHGRPELIDVITYGSYNPDDILAYAAALERGSSHVLAQTIVRAAEEKNLHTPPAQDITEESGHGLSGYADHKRIMVGRFSMLQKAGVRVVDHTAVHATATFVAIDGELAGALTFSDALREESKDMIRALYTLGVTHIAMVTGDNTTTAKAIAAQVGITDVYAECLPAAKVEAVKQMPHRPVAFVGDGVNDAPVLTVADVGIALGARGSTAASETADVVILLDDVSRVSRSIEIAKHTFYIARQSILLGIGISLVLMLVFATGKFPPVYGAMLQEVVDVVVIINALRAHGSWRRSTSRRTAKVVAS